MAHLESQENPYVGPRTFTAEEAHKFYGRNREARNLIGLIVSERIVLFYAQSGAGKSSLINTKIVPGLAAEGFEVLPIGRVSGRSGYYLKADNIFVYNLISSLHQKAEEPAEFSQMTLPNFLDNLVFEDGIFFYDDAYEYPPDVELKPRVLLIDQFEEILTTNAAFWKHREEFFKQLGEALALDNQLWVVLTMREDFIAGLDPYLHYLPDSLHNRFYMQRLNRNSALEAIKKPVADLRPFDDEAAEILADNLRLIHLEGDQEESHMGEFIEPVQLQAVCYQMWEKIKLDPGAEISKEDVEKYADVDTALITFYERTITETVTETGVSEIDLRDWFETDLITEAGTRNIVYRGDEMTGKIPTEVADFVKNKFIIRELVRPGGIWYELIHDRFVQPVMDSNNSWRLNQPLIRLCQEWLNSGRNDAYLLEGRQLDNFLDANWQALGPFVADFMKASQDARDLREKQQADEEAAMRQRELAQQQALAAEQKARAEEAEQATSRQKRLTRLAMGVGLIAVLAGLVAFGYFISAKQNEAKALENAAAAEVSEAEAEAQAATAVKAKAEAEAAQSTSDAAKAEAEADRDRRATAEAEAEAKRLQLQTRIAEISTEQAQAIANRDELNVALAAQEQLLEQLLTVTPTPTPANSAEEEAESPVIESSLPDVETTPTVTPTPDTAYEEIAVQLEEVRAKQTAVAVDSAAPQKITLGASVEGEPIEAIRFGNGPESIVLVGGIHAGKSPSTVDVAERMIEYFSRNPDEIPDNTSLYVVANLNPDSANIVGSVEGRLNANGVDLNRNWNCRWVADPIIGRRVVNGAGGTAPLSEPETSALADFLRGTDPKAVVIWYAFARDGQVVPGGCPQSEVSESLGRIYARETGYPLFLNEGEEVFAGDVTNWLDSVGIPTVGVLLPSHFDSDFSTNLEAVQALLKSFDS